MIILASIGMGTASAMAACGAAVLLWIACCEIARARDRRRHARWQAPRCPCGCPARGVPALPRDGRPLDGYERRRLASVIAGFRAPDALVPESSSERESHQ